MIYYCFACQNSSDNEPLYVASDFTVEDEFTAGIEGPAVDAQGNIYAVNYKNEGTIGKVDPQGNASLFVELPTGSIGNGIRISKEGKLLVADYKGHNILVVDTLDKSVSVYAHQDEMNQPNDIAMMDNGILFASDPNWGASTGNLWRIGNNRESNLLESGMGTTNGIEVSPDQKHLYVNESVQRKVWVYDISENGSISNKRLLHTFPDFGMDGMRCDIKGNLYITRYGKGTVAIISPDGQLTTEVILKGKKPSNITFGGADGKTCYVTMQDRGCLESFRTQYKGRAWKG